MGHVKVCFKFDVWNHDHMVVNPFLRYWHSGMPEDDVGFSRFTSEKIHQHCCQITQLVFPLSLSFSFRALA